VVGIDAIAGEAHGETARRGVVFDGFSSESADGLQPRQAKRCTGATEEKTTGRFHVGGSRTRSGSVVFYRHLKRSMLEAKIESVQLRLWGGAVEVFHPDGDELHIGAFFCEARESENTRSVPAMRLRIMRRSCVMKMRLSRVLLARKARHV
jgi:hypothetical protein